MRTLVIILLLAALTTAWAVDVLIYGVPGDIGYPQDTLWDVLMYNLGLDARINEVAFHDGSETSMTLDEMADWDVIIVDGSWYLYPGFYEPEETGNRMAAYVQDGGRVLLAGGALSLYSDNHLAGAIVSPPYSPVDQGYAGDQWTYTFEYDGDHPIFAGIDPIIGVNAYNPYCPLLSGGVLLANYDRGGNPSELAVNATDTVVAFNLLLGDTYRTWEGDVDPLVANACAWLASGSPAVVEMSWGAIKALSR